MEPGSSLLGCIGELPSPVLLRLTRSFLQVLNQWFRPFPYRSDPKGRGRRTNKKCENAERTNVSIGYVEMDSGS